MDDTKFKEPIDGVLYAAACGIKNKGQIEKPEKPVPHDLEEAAGEYAEKHGFRIPYDGSDNFYDNIDVKASKEGFIAGAEWQKEQDNAISRQAEAERIKTQQMCYEKGQADMKRKMMQEAVEGYVVKDITGSLAVTAKGINLDGFKFGDKVSVIVLPKED